MFKKLFDRLEGWLDTQDAIERRRLRLVRLIRLNLAVALKRHGNDRRVIDQLADLEKSMIDASDRGNIAELESVLSQVEEFK